MKLSRDWIVAGLRVLIPCVIAQNFTTGLTYGTFGTLLAANEEHFGISRAAASAAISVFSLAVAGLSPLIGGVLHRVPIRLAMIAGAIASALANIGLALAPSFAVALPFYALAGAGASVLGILGPATLISRWYVQGRARALAIVYLPIALLVFPPLVGEMLPLVGRTQVMLGIAGCFVLILPVLALIAEKPAAAGSAGTGETLAQGAAAEQPYATGAILSDPLFWLLSVAIGMLASVGAAFMVHIVPFGMEQHMSLQAASSLLTVYAAAGMVGPLLFGWASDRFGAAAALTFATFCDALIWTALLYVSGVPLFVLAGLMGLCVTSTNALHTAAMNDIFPVTSVSRALGLSYAVKLPFLLGATPAIALLYEIGQSYSLPFVILTVLMLVTSAGFLAMHVMLGKRKGLQPAAR